MPTRGFREFHPAELFAASTATTTSGHDAHSYSYLPSPCRRTRRVRCVVALGERLLSWALPVLSFGHDGGDFNVVLLFLGRRFSRLNLGH